MIEYALLVMLGFCAAGLLALLIAPTIWRRAVRLTTKRLDATLPMSLSDIEADKDLLRASYAIQIRRLEAGLNKARDKSASQLVEISKLQMVIGEFRDKVGGLEKQLEERSNAANVFERTIKKRFPELEGALTAAKAALDERSYEINDLSNEIRRREEALALIQRSSALQQQEIRKLRETLEAGSSDKTGRFKKRPSQWTLEEFRSEYDRLNLELSKMREQLALAQERESGQVAVLRGELQTLAEQIMTTVAAQEKQMAEQQRAADAAVLAAASAPRQQSPRPSRNMPVQRTQSTPQPWPRDDRDVSSEPLRPEPVRPPATATRPASRPTSPVTGTRPETPARPETDSAAVRPPEPRRPSITSEASSAGSRTETGSLKSLLNRATSAAAKETDAGAGAAQTPPQAPPAEDARLKETPVVSATRAGSAPGESTPVEQSAAAKLAEPNLDRMLREIFEGRPATTPNGEDTTAPAAPPAEPAKSTPPAVESAPTAQDTAADEAGREPESEKKQSLLERLRVV
jgi:hypothetical protein